MEPRAVYRGMTFSPEKEGESLPEAISQIRDKLEVYFKELPTLEKEASSASVAEKRKVEDDEL